MLKLERPQIIINKLIYFAEIGELYTITHEEMLFIVEKLEKINTKRRFKVSRAENYSVIWRTK